MESDKRALKINYTILAKVASVHEEFGSKYIGGAGKDCVFERYSIGWYVTFSGLHETLFFGHTKPEFNSGDKVKIIFERTDNGKTTDDQITSSSTLAN